MFNIYKYVDMNFFPIPIYIYFFFKFQNETRWFFFNLLKQEIALFISLANKNEFPLYPLSFASDLILWLEKSDMGTVSRALHFL